MKAECRQFSISEHHTKWPTCVDRLLELYLVPCRNLFQHVRLSAAYFWNYFVTACRYFSFSSYHSVTTAYHFMNSHIRWICRWNVILTLPHCDRGIRSSKLQTMFFGDLLQHDRFALCTRAQSRRRVSLSARAIPTWAPCLNPIIILAFRSWLLSYLTASTSKLTFAWNHARKLNDIFNFLWFILTSSLVCISVLWHGNYWLYHTRGSELAKPWAYSPLSPRLR